MLVFLLLSWILPAAYYSGQYVDQGRVQMGLFDLFNYPLTALSYFGYIALFIILVGGFYGILYKIPAYRTFLLLGPSVYWFEVAHSSGSDLFIALDSASGTLGRKQMEWLKGFLTGQRHMYRHCVILTHTNLFYTDNSQTGSGNMAMEETHALLDLFSRNNVTLCLQGHDHYREDLTFDGVRYTIVGTIRDEADKPEYLIIRLSDNGTEYIWKEL